MEVGGFKVSRLPLPMNWAKGCDQLANLARRMTDLYARVDRASEREPALSVSSQITETDKEIDDLVYELYELPSYDRATVARACTAIRND